MNPQIFFETRKDLRQAFLSSYGWSGLPLEPVGEDGAFRRYFRLRDGNGKSVILMEGVPEGHAMATPGHSIPDFVRLSQYLRAIGITAPQVYEVDDHAGYLLIEDFGDVSFKRAQQDSSAKRNKLYGLATDVLEHLRQQGQKNDILLPEYYNSHVHTGRRRVVDWYVPVARGQKNPDGMVEDYLKIWDQIEGSLPPVPCGFLHIDYHFENLMWNPDRAGLAQCGVLDFQGAMVGPVPYDLANLLEDARVDVPADLRVAMMDRYCSAMNAAEQEVFKAWYRVLATQFHCRVIGQFIRLAVLDGKDRYLPLIPRIAGYIREGQKDPVLAPIAAWFKSQKIDFSNVDGFSLEAAKAFIRPDAF